METETTLTTTDRVRSIIAESLGEGFDPERLNQDALDHVEIGMGLEEEFGLDNLDSDAVAGCRSLADYVYLVEGAMK